VIKIQVKVDTESTDATDQLLKDANSPLTPTDPQPSGGVCDSVLFAQLCSGGLGPWAPGQGCTTIKPDCVPPGLDNSQCVARNASVGSFVLWRVNSRGARQMASVEDESDPADGVADPTDVEARRRNDPRTVPRPHKAKPAKWVGCCVTKRPARGEYGPRTCKRIRVGKRFERRMQKAAGIEDAPGGRRLLTAPVRNPLRQLKDCQCFTIRLAPRTQPGTRAGQLLASLRARACTRLHPHALGGMCVRSRSSSTAVCSAPICSIAALAALTPNRQ
jgi:hypothetical protein